MCDSMASETINGQDRQAYGGKYKQSGTTKRVPLTPKQCSDLIAYSIENGGIGIWLTWEEYNRIFPNE